VPGFIGAKAAAPPARRRAVSAAAWIRMLIDWSKEIFKDSTSKQGRNTQAPEDSSWWVGNQSPAGGGERTTTHSTGRKRRWRCGRPAIIAPNIIAINGGEGRGQTWKTRKRYVSLSDRTEWFPPPPIFFLLLRASSRFLLALALLARSTQS